jgi:hypothetical protein
MVGLDSGPEKGIQQLRGINSDRMPSSRLASISNRHASQAEQLPGIACIPLKSRARPAAPTLVVLSCLLAGSPPHRYHLRLMNQVNQLLSALGQGDPHAAGRLLPLVCDQRKAQERS